MGCCEGRAGTTNTVERLKNGQILIPQVVQYSLFES